jgi:glycosyltransferase involved in cell wall biosynthesis
MKKRFKLLVFVKSIDGGTGSFVESLQKLYRISGQKVIIKTLVLEKPSFRKANSKFHYLRPRGFYPKIYILTPKTILGFFQEVSFFKHQLSQYEPDFVIGIDVHCNLIAGLVKMLFKPGLRLILTTHINLRGSLEEKGSQTIAFIMKKVITFVYPSANKQVAVSKAIAKSMKKDFEIKKTVETIYYGLPGTVTYRKKNSERRHRVILSVGRLVEQKDFGTLICAFQIVRKKFENVELWIIGDGPKKGEFKRLAKELKIDQYVRFLGWRQNADSFMGKSDIFALSTKREGFPYVLLEAIRAGLPVVSSDAKYGPSEILNGGEFGILVPVGDINALSNALIKLLKDKKLYNYYVHKSRERSKDFSEEKMLKSYSRMLSGLI